ncbi:hypothetical protein KAR91_48105 [Candidatus Pacearchaeota archaeon]|nr:hypothetical protein [Candidatus Pacearchaeota archaeon]
MGNTKRMLSEKDFSGVALYSKLLRVEKSEYMHIHWRDLRLLLTVDQFKKFFATLEKSYRKWDGQLSPGQDNLLEMSDIPERTIFERKGAIEEQHGDVIHFHYGDLRLELEPQTFLMLARLFEQAKREYNLNRIKMIPLKDINIYDPGHFNNKEDWLEYDKQHPERTDDYAYHRLGIEIIKIILCEEKRIMRPIPIVPTDDKYNRLDGFKRCIAWKEVYGNESMIPCYIEEGNVTPGNQDGQPWFLE